MTIKVCQPTCEKEQQGRSQSLHTGSEIPVSVFENNQLEGKPSVLILTTCSFKVNICRINEIEPKYYADGEDAYAMKRDLVVWSKQQVPFYNWMSENYVHHKKI